MIVERLVLGQLDTNCWLVSNEHGSLVVIDPADEAGRVLDAVAGRAVAWVVLTHGHFDHLGAVGEVLEATGAALAVHSDDASAMLSAATNGAALFGFDFKAPRPDRELSDGDVIEADRLRLEVLHTPGHTPGGICLLAGGELFSGDTLFAGSVGRTDFPGGDGLALRRSIQERLSPLPDETVVHPGHGPDTTIRRERKINPFFPRA